MGNFLGGYIMRDSFIIFVIVILSAAVIALAIQGIKEGKAKAELIESDIARNITLIFFDTVKRVVGRLNQTVVDPLKNSSEYNFDKEAQRTVLEDAKKAIKKELDVSSKKVLTKTYGDLDVFITDSIEAEVRKQKK